MRRPRMPRVIRLPFGFAIKVKYRTSRQLVAAGLSDCHGAWVGSERAIYVCRDDHIGEQAETIAHELQHAGVDFRHYVDQFVRLPLKLESAETALDLAEEGEDE